MAKKKIDGFEFSRFARPVRVPRAKKKSFSGSLGKKGVRGTPSFWTSWIFFFFYPFSTLISVVVDESFGRKFFEYVTRSPLFTPLEGAGGGRILSRRFRGGMSANGRYFDVRWSYSKRGTDCGLTSPTFFGLYIAPTWSGSLKTRRSSAKLALNSDSSSENTEGECKIF